MANNRENAEHVTQAAELLEESRTGVVLTGHIKNGKVELDQSTMERVREGFPGADVAFIAVNAPFDAVSQAV